MNKKTTLATFLAALAAMALGPAVLAQCNLCLTQATTCDGLLEELSCLTAEKGGLQGDLQPGQPSETGEQPSGIPPRPTRPTKAPSPFPIEVPELGGDDIPAGPQKWAIDQEISQCQRLIAARQKRLASMCPAAPQGQSKSGAKDWEVDLSASEYQKTFDEHAAKGFRLRTVSGYTRNGQERYAALWTKEAGPAWVARHGLTEAQYLAELTQKMIQGFRPVYLCGHAAGSQPHFAAIWEKTGGPDWVARHNLSSSQYQQAFLDYARQGFRLRHVCGYTVGGGDRFAAIWDKSSGPAWAARHDLTPAQYQQTFDQLAKQGYRLKEVSGYGASGNDRYAALWEKTTGPAWVARHGLPEGSLPSVATSLEAQGYRLVHLNAFASGSGARFNGLWTK